MTLNGRDMKNIFQDSNRVRKISIDLPRNKGYNIGSFALQSQNER